MNITEIDNTNFQARLVKSNLKYNQTRWNRISKLFEESTKDFPNDKFVLMRLKENNKHFFTLDSKNNKVDARFASEEWFGNLLLNFSDNEINEKFVKLFKGMKIAQKGQNLIKKASNHECKLNLEKQYSDEIINTIKGDRFLISTSETPSKIALFNSDCISYDLGVRANLTNKNITL